MEATIKYKIYAKGADDAIDIKIKSLSIQLIRKSYMDIVVMMLMKSSIKVLSLLEEPLLIGE